MNSSQMTFCYDIDFSRAVVQLLHLYFVLALCTCTWHLYLALVLCANVPQTLQGRSETEAFRLGFQAHFLRVYETLTQSAKCKCEVYTKTEAKTKAKPDSFSFRSALQCLRNVGIKCKCNSYTIDHRSTSIID